MNTQRVEGHTPLNIRIAEWCADNAAIAANPKTPLGAQLEIAYKLMNEQSSGIERLEKVNEALVRLAERCAGLNEHNPEIGAGMLMTIVTEARAALSLAKETA